MANFTGDCVDSSLMYLGQVRLRRRSLPPNKFAYIATEDIFETGFWFKRLKV